MYDRSAVDFLSGGIRRALERVRETDPLLHLGRVERVVGLVIEASGPEGCIGELCTIRDRKGRRRWWASGRAR